MAAPASNPGRARMRQTLTTSAPKGYYSVTPFIVVKDIAQSIDFYRRAFGAEERMRMPGPDGKRVMHAELGIGDSVLMLGDESPERGCFVPASLKGHTGGLYLYVSDVDAAFARATRAGAKGTMNPTDMFWGDRVGEVEDPSGHRWSLATRKEDLTPAEMRERAQVWFASQGKA
jgi:PhnB protein